VPARDPSQVRVTGPLAPHADGFRAALDAQGFSPWSQMFYLHLLADVSRWLAAQNLDGSGLTGGPRFGGRGRACGPPPRPRSSRTGGPVAGHGSAACKDWHR
jgi:hypothetical protein